MGLPKPRNEVLIRKLARETPGPHGRGQAEAGSEEESGCRPGRAEPYTLKKQRAFRGFEGVSAFSGHGELIENQPVHVRLRLYKENRSRDGCFYIWLKRK